MSNAQTIDWTGIQVAAVALQNVRAAARQAAANLPDPERTTLIERINKRALREGWLEKAANVQAVHAAETALSKNVQTGAEIVQNTLLEDDKETRSKLSKAMRAGAEHAASLPGEAVLKQARNVHELAKGAATVHGWDAGSRDVRINVFADGTKVVEAIEIESEATSLSKHQS